jgi:tripartite-type tricarboxylate transporter receptor subunit TctC
MYALTQLTLPAQAVDTQASSYLLAFNLAMKLSPRLLFAVIVADLPLSAFAQTEPVFPSRPLRIVVPFFAGGTPDIQKRIISDKLAQRLGQPVVIDNRGGANGVIGMELVSRAPADGHTVVCSGCDTWTGIGAPARTPRAAVKRLNRDIAAILQMADVQQRYAEGGSLITGGTPEQLQAYLKTDLEKYGKLIKAVGIKGS